MSEDMTGLYGPGAVAEILDDDGTVIDVALSWQTARNYALHEGRRVRVLADDGTMTRDRLQRLCDMDRALYRDCYGLD